MKKFIKIFFVLAIGTMMWNVNLISAQAAGDVGFSVDSVKGKQGSSKTVAVNIFNNSEVAGIDCVLSYDPSLMEYVDSSKGNTLKKSGFCDINPDAGAATVHLVYGALPGMSKEGEVMTVEFKLLQDINDGYTPQLAVNDLFDASDEINELAYVITTNPADTQTGTEAGTEGTQDSTQAAETNTSGTKTDGTDSSEGSAQEDNKNTEESKTTDGAAGAKANADKATDKEADKTGTSDKNQASRDPYIGLAVGVIAILVLVVLSVYLIRKKRHQKD